MSSEGAIVDRRSLVTMVEGYDRGPTEAWVRLLASGQFEVVIFLSAEGVTSLVDVATDLGIREDFLAALRRTIVATRGPRPACALYELGIPVEVRSAQATEGGVIESLRRRDLGFRHIGVQRKGDDTSGALIDFLLAARAHVHTVSPYRFTAAGDDQQVQECIEQIAQGQLDAIVFTASLQVERLFDVAGRQGLEMELRSGLDRIHVAAGGGALNSLRRFDVRADSTPERQFFMRRLLEALAAALGPGPA